MMQVKTTTALINILRLMYPTQCTNHDLIIASIGERKELHCLRCRERLTTRATEKELIESMRLHLESPPTFEI